MTQGESTVGGAAGAARAAAGSGASASGAGGRWRRAGVAGAAIGLVAAGVAAERLTVHRGVREKARMALDAAGPYGSLRGTPGTAVAEDGTELYYEVDELGDAVDEFPETDSGGEVRGAGEGEPAPPGAAPEGSRGTPGAGPGPRTREAAAAAAHDGTGGPSVAPIRLGPPGAQPSPPLGEETPEASQRGRLLRLLRGRRGRHGDRTGGAEAGSDGALPTVVFCHGYCLGQDVWHFQRAALRGALRAVYWDQRSHGRSARAPVGEPVSIDLLGRDLKAVLDAAVPEGPIVLIGHSMGGMTMMALAAQYPGFVAERVVGAAFLGTSAGGLGDLTYGLPLPPSGVKVLRRVVPGVLKALVAQAELVERGRRAAADLLAGLVKRYSFGAVREVDAGVARFAERLIESVPIDVVAEFYPAFEAHEKTEALAAFDGRPALVLIGDRDLLTPHAHSEAIASALPAARLEVLERTGHLAMLERPEAVNERIAELLTRTIRTHGQGSTAAHPGNPARTRRGRRNGGSGGDDGRRTGEGHG
ncbi:alpha/beta hydrolase [Streptomyces sp. ODS28]|uniref:alpha/beta fold hydrolase n=1 Tax=Streptomyces sp. ODS28 TaxID=3136688 RepID=UPI0031EF1283